MENISNFFLPVFFFVPSKRWLALGFLDHQISAMQNSAFSGAVAKTVIAPADRVKCPGRDLQRTGEKGPTTPR